MFYFLPDDPDLRRRTIDQLILQLDVDVKRLWKRVEQAPGHMIGEPPLRPLLGTAGASSAPSSSESCQQGVPYENLQVTFSGLANNDGCADCTALNGQSIIVPWVGEYAGTGCYNLHAKTDPFGTVCDLRSYVDVWSFGPDIYVHLEFRTAYNYTLWTIRFVHFNSIALPQTLTFMNQEGFPQVCDGSSASVYVEPAPASSVSTSGSTS